MNAPPPCHCPPPPPPLLLLHLHLSPPPHPSPAGRQVDHLRQRDREEQKSRSSSAPTGAAGPHTTTSLHSTSAPSSSLPPPHPAPPPPQRPQLLVANLLARAERREDERQGLVTQSDGGGVQPDGQKLTPAQEKAKARRAKLRSSRAVRRRGVRPYLAHPAPSYPSPPAPHTGPARVGGMRSSSDNITQTGVSSRLDAELEKMIGDMDREESIAHLMKMRKGQARLYTRPYNSPPHPRLTQTRPPTHASPAQPPTPHPPAAPRPPRPPSPLPRSPAGDRPLHRGRDGLGVCTPPTSRTKSENRRDTGLEGHDIEKTIAARYGLGKDELEGNKEALMRRVNYKQHASKASRIFQSGPAWVG